MSWRRIDYFFAGSYALILVAALGFGREMVIVNALSGEVEQEFGIHISPWRVVFEPVLGPLLFILRGERTLISYVVLLGWIIAGWLIVSLATGGRGEPWQRILWRRILGVPLLGGTWLAISWFMILTPVPSNTIDPGDGDKVLINTHAHTDQGHDGIISPDALRRWHLHNRFDAYFMTEHNMHHRSMEMVRSQQSGQIPPEPLIMCGEEYWGTNHMTLLGLDGSFGTGGKNEREVIALTHQVGGVVIVAHWWEKELASIPFFVELGVDGFEIANQTVGPCREEIFKEMVQTCKNEGLLMLGSVDNHGYGSTCGVWTVLDIPGWQALGLEERRAAVMETLNERDQERITVLLYQDRPDHGEVHSLFLPLASVVNYFRTLNGWQLVSWLLWMVVFRTLLVMLAGAPGYREGTSLRPWLSGSVSLVAACYMITVGLIFKFRTGAIEDYHGVYHRYSLLLMIAGFAFLVYIIFWLWYQRGRKPSGK
jgi:hypothetical protein